MKMRGMAAVVVMTACLVGGCSSDGSGDARGDEETDETSQEAVAAVARAPQTVIASELNLRAEDIAWQHDVSGERKLIWYRKGSIEVLMMTTRRSVPLFALTVRHNGSAERAPTKFYAASIQEYVDGKPRGAPTMEEMKERVREFGSILRALRAQAAQASGVQPANACLTTLGVVETLVGIVGGVGAAMGVLEFLAAVPATGSWAATAMAACAAAPLACAGAFVVAGVVSVGGTVLAHTWLAQRCYVR